MLDLGQQATERIYADVQRRLKSNYRQAVHEVQAKLDDFTKRHKAADLKMRKKLADGLITKEEYRAWQRGQVYQGDLWRKQVNNLTETLYSSDVIAQRIVNEQRLNVFASNANAMAYSMEHGEGLDFGFGYYDSATVSRILKDQPNLLPPRTVKRKEDVEWYHKIVNNCVTQGILQGEGIPAIAKRIAETTGERSYNAAVRNARTAMTSAQNAGRIEVMHEAERMGIKVKKRWLATLDDRTRDAHADLDGQVQEVDDYFESSLGPILFPGDPSAEPANVYNCFVGETNVATDSDIIRSYKHDYSGELITVKTACGVEFTCTPNHPILTPGGWVAAKCLNNGDNLLIASIGEVYALRVNPNVDHTLSRIDAIHKFFDITGSKRTVSLGVNFHGDVPTSDVEVITQKRFLRDNGNTGCADSVDKFLLKHSDESLMGKSAFMQHFGRVRLASLRLICGFGKALAFFGCSLAHTVIHGFGAVARRDTTVFEPQADTVTGNVQFLGDGLDGLSGKVFLDDIVNINITTVSHIPVYNLQTGNNRYFVNSIITQNGEKCNGNFAIAHNCRCTLIYEHPEYPSNFERRDNIDGEVIGDMTYREWENWKNGESEQKPIPVVRNIEYGILFPSESKQITRDTLNDLRKEHPLSQELDYVGDVRTHRGLDQDVEIFDLSYEYPNLVPCGAQYLPQGADGKSGPCIEIHKESYSTKTLQEEFDDRYALRVKYGDPMQPPKPGHEFYEVSSTLEGTIRHEYGHALSDDNGVFSGNADNPFRIWQRSYWETHKAELTAISKYAASHPDEMFAEAFVQAQDTRHPNTLAYKMAREIMDAFERYKRGAPL